jgi:hypothetical protein
MSLNEPDSNRVAISVQGLKKSCKNIVKILTTLLQKRWMEQLQLPIRFTYCR